MLNYFILLISCCSFLLYGAHPGDQVQITDFNIQNVKFTDSEKGALPTPLSYDITLSLTDGSSLQAKSLNIAQLGLDTFLQGDLLEILKEGMWPSDKTKSWFLVRNQRTSIEHDLFGNSNQLEKVEPLPEYLFPIQAFRGSADGKYIEFILVGFNLFYELNDDKYHGLQENLLLEIINIAVLEDSPNRNSLLVTAKNPQNDRQYEFKSQYEYPQKQVRVAKAELFDVRFSKDPIGSTRRLKNWRIRLTLEDGYVVSHARNYEKNDWLQWPVFYQPSPEKFIFDSFVAEGDVIDVIKEEFHPTIPTQSNLVFKNSRTGYEMPYTGLSRVRQWPIEPQKFIKHN